jgi:hypothetical protein
MKNLLDNLPFKLSDSRAVVSFLGRRGKRLENFGHERNNLAGDLEADNTAPTSLGKDRSKEGDERIITEAAPDNPHPEKNVIPAIHPLRGLRRVITHLWLLPRKIVQSARPERSAEEIAIIERAKADANFLKKKMPDLKLFAHRCIGRMTRLEFMNVVHEGSKRRVQTVRPDMVVVDRGGRKYTMGLAIENLPSGVKLTKLVEEETMTELIPAVGMRIKGELDVAGVRIIGYPSGELGLPVFTPVDEMWDKAPDNLPMLSFPVGIGENGKPFYKDLDDCPHLLIVGGSKQGKSNMINVILCTYLRRLTPLQVQFVLFDLKRGMEFCYYENIQHLLIDQEKNIPGIVDRIEQAMPAMRGLMWIMEHRMDFIKGQGFKNINDFNSHHIGKNRLPALVVIFDEYAQIGLEFGDEADKLIANLSNMARAAGIYIIIGSQYPRADVLTTLATINFQVRIAFNMTGPASNAMIGSHAAAGLVCRGRAVLMDYDHENEIQTPRISDSTIHAIVKHAIDGKPIAPSSKVDIEEIMQVALEEFDGLLEVQKLFPLFRGKISYKKLQAMLKAADDKTFDIEGTNYLVTTSKGRSRRMILAEDDQITESESN